MMNKSKYNEITKELREESKKKGTSSNYILKNDKLYKEKDEKLIRILKKDEIEPVMYMTHEHPLGGHLGRDAMYNKIINKFYWKNMKNDIQEYVRTCEQCQKRGNIGSKGLLNPIKVGKTWEMIGIDFVGPLNKTRKGNKYILVVMDYFTKYPEARATKDATADKVAEFLFKEIICRHGCPKIMISDNGSHFRNQVVKQLCEKYGIKHNFTSPYHPQSNGLVERFNRTLCESLAKLSNQEKQWDEFIEPALFAYRTTKHSTTKYTPYYLMHGKEARLPIDEEELPEEVEDFSTLLLGKMYELINLEEKRDQALYNIEQSQEKQKKRHDERIKEVTFEIGEQVLLKDSAKEKQWSGKLESKWKGPYKIYEIIGKGAYKLQDENGKISKTTHNVKKLKKYHERNLISRLNNE